MFNNFIFLKNISRIKSLKQFFSNNKDSGLENPKYSSMAIEISKYFEDLKGKKVLEVGCDSKGELIQYFGKTAGVGEIIGLNPSVQSSSISKNCHFVSGDIRKTQFSDNYFDHIYSLAAFEHVFNLDEALEEMYRILKPGGLLYSKFGPIWSCSVGHHLWTYHAGEAYTFTNTVLPPYCHLIMSPKELTNYLSNSYPTDVNDAIVHYIYSSKEQNRLFYEDYERIINNSPFTTLFFYGTSAFPHSEKKLPIDFKECFLKLNDTYPNYHQFSYNVIYFLLAKL